MENFNFTPIFEAIITIVSLVLTGIVIPYIRQRIGEEKAENLKKWVSVGVKAAEQMHGSKTGQQKKEYVISFLNSKGINFNVDEVEALIEAEVFKITNIKE